MPHPARSDVDWNKVKAEFEAGVPKTVIEKGHGVRRQSIDDRAEKEGWVRGDKNKALLSTGSSRVEPEEFRYGGDRGEALEATGGPYLPGTPKQPDVRDLLLSKLPDLIKETDTYVKWEKAKDMPGSKGIHLGPESLEQACRLALDGATWSMIADGVGLTPQGFKYHRNGDERLEALLRRCHAVHAARRLHNLNDAAERGDLRAITWSLEHGPYRHEISDVGPGGKGPNVQVVLNIGDPTQADVKVIDGQTDGKPLINQVD